MAVMQPERIARAVEYEWPPLLPDQTVLMDSYNSTSSLHSHTSGVILDLTIRKKPDFSIDGSTIVMACRTIARLITLAINSWYFTVVSLNASEVSSFLDSFHRLVDFPTTKTYCVKTQIKKLEKN